MYHLVSFVAVGSNDGLLDSRNALLGCLQKPFQLVQSESAVCRGCVDHSSPCSLASILVHRGHAIRRLAQGPVLLEDWEGTCREAAWPLLGTPGR